MKIWVRRLLRWSGTLAWTGGAAVLVAWMAGQMFTDRWHWSQYLFWMPTMLVQPAAILGVVVGLGLRRVSRMREARRAGRGERAAMVASVLVLAGASGYAAIWEWRMLASTPAAGDRVFRVLHWNATSDIGKSWPRLIMERDPDLIVINPASFQLCREIVSVARPYEAPVYRHGFTVISRYRVVRLAYATLGVTQGTGIDPRESDLTGHHRDPGRALWVELDTREALGRTLKVLCVDLPSDVSLHRLVSATEASKALSAFGGPFSVRGEDGVWSQETPETAGMGEPDLLVGDLNTPRGSHSLRVLTGGMSSVYDDAGRGPFGTWPYARPFWHLDHMFIGPWLRGVRYEPVDLGGGTHRGQVADLTVREPL